MRSSAPLPEGGDSGFLLHESCSSTEALGACRSPSGPVAAAEGALGRPRALGRQTARASAAKILRADFKMSKVSLRWAFLFLLRRARKTKEVRGERRALPHCCHHQDTPRTIHKKIRPRRRFLLNFHQRGLCNEPERARASGP